MWRATITLFIILLSAIGGMLFWQWDAYSQQNNHLNEERLEKAEQQISLESEQDKFLVTQKIHGLTSGTEYRILVPDSIRMTRCVQSDGSDCQSNDEHSTTFRTDDGSFTFLYEIDQIKEQPAFLLNEWTGHLLDIKITKTSLEIIDSTKREGTWITGLPLKGFEELEYIDYYVFEGEERDTSIFWHSTPLLEKRGPSSISYYLNEDNDDVSFTFEAVKEIPDFPQTTIVFTDRYPETKGKGVIIVPPDKDQQSLEFNIIYTYFSNKFTDLPTEERWLIDTLASLFVEDESISPKGKALVGELKKNLRAEELSQLLKSIVNEKILSPQKLDELVGKVKGENTNTRFFTLNKNEETELIPLFYYDSRDVSVNGTIYNDLEVVYFGNDQLFPFNRTMTLLGFKVEELSNKDTFLLKKGSNRYRFYVDQNIFIYNEEDYGLLENPLTILNGEVYMGYNWLQSLFKTTLEEEEGRIHLSM